MTDPTLNMSPTASPGGQVAQTEVARTGLRRLNKVPLFAGASVVVLFLLVVASVMNDRSALQKAKPSDLAKTQASTDADKMAEHIAGANGAGVVPANGLPQPPALQPPNGLPANGSAQTPGGQPPINMAPVPPLDPNAPPLPTGNVAGQGGGVVNPLRQQRMEMLVQLRQMKQAQFTSALKSTSTVSFQSTRSPGSPSSGSNTSTIAKLDSLRQQMLQNAAQGQMPSASDMASYTALTEALAAQEKQGAGGSGNPSPSRPANDVSQFSRTAGTDRWQLGSKTEAPRSRFEVRAGFVIPGILVSGVNSSIPGQIIAQVSQNVYDTPTGKFLLVPQGSRLVGSYSSSVSYGQSRLLVAWQRIVFPDGKALDIDAMPGASSAGYGGFKDQVNNHYARTFGSALILSGIVAGIQLSQQQSVGAYSLTPSQAATQGLGQVLGETAAHMVEKNMSIAPTLQIRPGYRFNLVVVKDLEFTKPYRNFDY
ncbi:TrbI/VirB10 family protein [Novosphingobium terrae]|uniref:TrbI/VirB10 family protein n=1 Tax=Novosphingobium terrae TaxID=2726189 RepID=UPI0019827027|nr:TrbI/VirB10 family protein [Novosphingobium terrae]